jgi:hypothetical protein
LVTAQVQTPFYPSLFSFFVKNYSSVYRTVLIVERWFEHLFR